MHVLFFAHAGANSRSTLLDLARGYERAGHRVSTVELAPIWAMLEKAGPRRDQAIRSATEQVRRYIRTQRVDLTVGLWANAMTVLAHTARRDGVVRSFFDELGVPHLMFWLDAPHWAHEGRGVELVQEPAFHGPMLHHLINNAATAEEMRRVLGMRNVIARPYGVNEAAFRPHDVEKRYDLVFALGSTDAPPTPMMQAELLRDEPDVEAIRAEAARAALPMALAVADRFPTGLAPSVEEAARRAVELQVESRHTPALHRIERIAAEEATLVPAVRALLSDARSYVQLTSACRQVEQWERSFTFAHLYRHFRCATFGAGSMRAWGVEPDSFGMVDYEAQARIYSRGRFGLSLMRWQDDWGLNIKPLEIAASGAGVLVGRREGLDELLRDGDEALAFDTPGEARRLLADALETPGRAESIARAGRRRVLADHTWTRRAQEVTLAMSRPDADESGQATPQLGEPKPTHQHVSAGDRN